MLLPGFSLADYENDTKKNNDANSRSAANVMEKQA